LGALRGRAGAGNSKKLRSRSRQVAYSIARGNDFSVTKYPLLSNVLEKMNISDAGVKLRPEDLGYEEYKVMAMLNADINEQTRKYHEEEYG